LFAIDFRTALEGGDELTGFFRLAFAGLALFAGFSAALAGEWPPNEQLSAESPTARIDAWYALKDRFGVENLSDQTFLQYAALLAERDCAGAADLVLASHRRSDAEFAARVADPVVEDAWLEAVAPFRFPGIGLCQSRASIENAILRVMAEGPPEMPVTAILKIASRVDTSAMPYHLSSLIVSLQVVFNRAIVGNPDTIRYLLNEVETGGIVALTGEQRLALLMRLDALGVGSQAEQAEAKALADTVGEAAIAAAQEFARLEYNSGFERWQAFQKRLAAIALK
jgi:hypothetical protein